METHLESSTKNGFGSLALTTVSQGSRRYLRFRRVGFCFWILAQVLVCILARASEPGVTAVQTDPTIIDRGLDFRVWQTLSETQIGGRTNRQVQTYKELRTGLHYITESGELAESQ